MPRSPTSSEDEMAQTESDFSGESGSSREENIYETIRSPEEPPKTPRPHPVLVRDPKSDPRSNMEEQSHVDDPHVNSMVIRVLIPTLQQTKCMRFNPDASVWVAKQRILCTLTQSLKDVLNYGLFQPPHNGRDGKFLDEERQLGEYPQPLTRGVPSLQFRYKSRVYRPPNVDEKQIAKLHSKANLKKFMDHVQHNQVDKVSKLLDRGLDPNYQDSDSGESPLSLAVSLDDAQVMIPVLLAGGAHLDFRAKDGMTALHKAARSRSLLSLTTLLELGASPDYKDSRGLTPLYHSVLVGADPGCCELLLNQRAAVGCQDENGWHEVHQACRHGNVQHLEHLLFYGADMSAQNASGNTALHICALYNQDHCARVLLVRGADKDVKNFNSQTPFQVKSTFSSVIEPREKSAFPWRRVGKRGKVRGSKEGGNKEYWCSTGAVLVLLVQYWCYWCYWCSTGVTSVTGAVLVQYWCYWCSTGAVLVLLVLLVLLVQYWCILVQYWCYWCYWCSTGAVLVLLVQYWCSTGVTGVTGVTGAVLVLLVQYWCYWCSTGAVLVQYWCYWCSTGAVLVQYWCYWCSTGVTGAVLVQYWCSTGVTGAVLVQYWCSTGAVLVLLVQYWCSTGVTGAVLVQYWCSTGVTGAVLVQYWCSTGVTGAVLVQYWCYWCSTGAVLVQYWCYWCSTGAVLVQYWCYWCSTGAVLVLLVQYWCSTGVTGAVLVQYWCSTGVTGAVLVQYWCSTGVTADTPIEEFTPTAAFPALQYLESVDEGGVAWQAGLRTGDFLIEVNQENVVKVGHRQVVNMIRQGGNRLLIKVVTVSRNLDPDDTARKKAPPPPKRAPTTALSMRSKSMTSELEELVDKATLRKKKSDPQKRRIIFQVTLNKVEEMSHAQKTSPFDTKIATIKPRPTSRCLVTAADMNSLYHERQGVAVVPPTVPGAFLGLPEKSTMKKQKSIEDEKHGFLTPPLLKFSRSLSMPDTSEDIPPPPASSPPSPPGFNSGPGAKGYGTTRPSFNQNSPNAVTTISRDVGTLRRGYFRQSSEQFESTRTRSRAPIPENPYSEVGNRTLYIPAKPARRKGMLVKQSNVEDSPEKHVPASPSGPVSMPTTPVERTCSSIPIPTIIIKEPSTSSSGKSSQGSSMEIEPTTPEHPPLMASIPGSGGLRPDDPSLGNPFTVAIAGAVRDREKRLEARKHSIAFQSIDMGDDEFSGSTPTPRLRQSKSIDEGMFSSDERLRRILAPPTVHLGKPVGGGSGNMTDFNTPEPMVVREPLSTRTGHCPNFDSPASLPSTSPKSHYRANGTYLHPVTGKPLDPNSPLALALAARDRAMKEQQNHPQTQQQQNLSQVQTPKREAQSLPPIQPSHKTDLNQPLFIDTKLRSRIETSFAEISSTTMGRGRGGLRRQMTEQKYESDSAREERKHQAVEERKSAPPDVTEQPKSAGLLMVHTTDASKVSAQDAEDSNTPSELKDPNQPESQNSLAPLSNPPSRRRSIPLGESLDEPVKLPFRIPPPPLASVDIEEEFEFSDPLPPPLEFANSIDISDDQASAYAEMLQQQRRNGGPPLPPYHHHAPPSVADHHKRLANSVPPPSFQPHAPPQPDPESMVGDSGIEEVDSRSSGDPQHMESISNVSSISTLSSEGGFCDSALESLYAGADGHAFLADRPPVPPKPKGKSVINRTSLYHDALIEEPPEAFGASPAGMTQNPASASAAEAPRTPTQRSSKLWGVPELRSPPTTPDTKNTVMTELSTILQHMNRPNKPADALDSPPGGRAAFGTRPSDDSGLRSSSSSAAAVGSPLSSSTPPSSLTPHPHSPLPCTPPDCSLTPCSSLPPSASPTLTDVFSQGGYSLSSSCGGSGSSRSPSPLTLLQAVAASGKPFASKPVELWSKHDVADWLDSLNLGEHKDAFLDNEIEGAHLPSLQKEDLIDLGVTRVGHRMNIERALKLLQDR
ncbi:SH3 and multiple ankyrin repeat domains protein 2b [Eucyclogobius newberryi]|uniref:SH3 and multiple ankyrin repeat domains protein 2b n=1 Tax=Eucyclogobius newberryi TaxID=166745 RepID=UPI003B59E724